MMKLLTLLYEVKTMRVIFETLKNLLGPLNNLVMVMLTIFYVFAQMGSALFGGEIREDSPSIIHDSSIPDNYYLMNFNDLTSSMVTLFALIVVNNWYVIVAMCVDVKGGDTIYRYYFVVFYYFGVIIGLNIIIAFAIDMYAAVSRLEEQKDTNKSYLLKLADKHAKAVAEAKKEENGGSETDSDETDDSDSEESGSGSGSGGGSGSGSGSDSEEESLQDSMSINRHVSNRIHVAELESVSSYDTRKL